MSEWDAFREALIAKLSGKVSPKSPKFSPGNGERPNNGDFGDTFRGMSENEYGNALLATLDLSRVSARRFMGEEEGASPSAPEPRTASITLPADNRSPGEPPTHGGPQGDRLKELLLPFQAWPVALALDGAGQIQVKVSRLLLPQMQEYCERHGPELQAFLESCPGHTWSTMKNQTR